MIIAPGRPRPAFTQRPPAPNGPHGPMQAIKRSAPVQKQTIRIEPSKLVKRRRLEAWAREKQKYHAEVEQEEKQKVQQKKDALKEQVAQGKKRAKIKTAAHQQELEAESGEDVDSEEEEEAPAKKADY